MNGILSLGAMLHSRSNYGPLHSHSRSLQCSCSLCIYKRVSYGHEQVLASAMHILVSTARISSYLGDQAKNTI